MSLSELLDRFDHRWWLNRLRYAFAGDTQRRTIAGVTVTYTIENFREYRRLQGFTGEKRLL